MLMTIMRAGNEEGIQIAKDIVAMGVSKYRACKDLKISDTQFYNWLRGIHAPSEDNYRKLIQYKSYLKRLELVKRDIPF